MPAAQTPLPTLPRPAAPAAADTARGVAGAIADSARSFAQLASDPNATAADLAVALQERLLAPALWMGVLSFLVKAVVLVLLAHGVLRLIRRASQAYVGRYDDLAATDPRRQRMLTLSAILTSAARYIVWPVTVIAILDSAGVSVTSLLATAGIAGLAVGFGAQTLVRDVISGFFLLFDNTLRVGDTVRIGADEGTVEFIGVRLIKVRKFDGELLMVPSGELRVFGNRSFGFARVVVNVTVPFGRDPDPVLAAMRTSADAWAAEHRGVLLDAAPEVQAITTFGDATATARIVAKVLPGEQFAAERDLRRRLLADLAAAGITLGSGPNTVLVRSASEAVEPPGPSDPEAAAKVSATPPDPNAPPASPPAAPLAPLPTKDPRGPSDPPSVRPPTEL